MAPEVATHPRKLEGKKNSTVVREILANKQFFFNDQISLVQNLIVKPA